MKEKPINKTRLIRLLLNIINGIHATGLFDFAKVQKWRKVVNTEPERVLDDLISELKSSKSRIIDNEMIFRKDNENEKNIN